MYELITRLATGWDLYQDDKKYKYTSPVAGGELVVELEAGTEWHCRYEPRNINGKARVMGTFTASNTDEMYYLQERVAQWHRNLKFGSRKWIDTEYGAYSPTQDGGCLYVRWDGRTYVPSFEDKDGSITVLSAKIMSESHAKQTARRWWNDKWTG